MSFRLSTANKCFIKLYLWAAEMLYHRFAWAYDVVAWLVSFGFWSVWREDALTYIEPGRILEVGSGTGGLLMEMVARGYEVIGLEPSPQMLWVLRRKACRKGISLKCIRGQAQAIPFQQGSFTTVLSTFPTNYVLQRESLVEVRRVLSIKGCWVILGLGVVFKSAFRRWLSRFVFGELNPQVYHVYSKLADETGFSTRWVYHETRKYTLPVLILEKKDD